MRWVRFVPVWLLVLAVTAGAAEVPKPKGGSFPTFGVSFTPPADAHFEVTSSPGHIGLYVFDDKSPSKGAAILVEISPSVGKNLEEFAQAIAARVGASPSPVADTVGGEKALKLEAAYMLKSYTRRSTVLVEHGDRVYMFSELTSPGTSAAKPLAEMLKSVALTPPVAPLAQAGTFFAEPFTVLEQFTMNGPAALRRYDDTPKHLNLGLRDLRPEGGGVEPLHVVADSLTLPNRATFETIREQYSSSLPTKLGSTDAITWEVHPKIPGLHIGSPMHAAVKFPDGTEHAILYRFCILDLGGGEMVQILFMIAAGKAEEDKAWIDISRKMLDTIKLRGQK